MARCMKPDPILIHRVCAHRYLYRLFAPSTARSRDWGTVLHASTLRLPSKGAYYAADTAGTDALTHPYPWNQAWARSVTPYGPWGFREPHANGLSAPSRSLVFHHDTPVSDRSKDLFSRFDRIDGERVQVPSIAPLVQDPMEEEHACVRCDMDLLGLEGKRCSVSNVKQSMEVKCGTHLTDRGRMLKLSCSFPSIGPGNAQTFLLSHVSGSAPAASTARPTIDPACSCSSSYSVYSNPSLIGT